MSFQWGSHFPHLDGRAGWRFFYRQRYFIIVQLRYIRGQWHRPSIVLIYSISGQIRCVSLWTFSLRVKPQLPLQFIWLPDLGRVSGKWNVPNSIMAATATNPGSNLPKVLPRKSHVIETVSLSLALWLCITLCFMRKLTDLYSLPSIFFLCSSHGFSFFPVPLLSPLSSTFLYPSPRLSHIRSPADNLQQPGVHQNWWQWREGAPLPGPNLRPVLQRPASAQTGSRGRPQRPDPG